MRRLAAIAALLLAVLVLHGPAAATDATEPTPAPSLSPTASPPPGDGIREIPTEDEGADVYSVATILIFFAIAMVIFVLIIRAGMRSSDRED
ncbi:hypothetical protein [Aeromicrobium sp. CTD01-1L150]|uniref:hypothetical protein n=1 Tax=Aeromicrobium sp. CTD01-1L150 TaxID=3341830 RepID=UPI0035C1B8F1